HRVGQLDALDAVGGEVLRALVEPDAVRLLDGLGTPAQVVGRVHHLEVEVAQVVGGGQSRHAGAEHRHVQSLHQLMTLPPSITSTSPVRLGHSQRSRPARAISSGSATRRRGVVAYTACFWSSGMPSHISVETGPGAIALTRTSGA